MKRLNRICFLVSIVFVLAVNLFARQESEEVQRIRQRAETFLQTIREEKWSELDKFVVVITKKSDKKTRERMGISENADEKEIKEKVAAWFKKLYGVLKPGNKAGVRIDEKDKTKAFIRYMHEDLDGFYMVLIDGEWYYTLE